MRLLNVLASGFGATETEPASGVGFPNDVLMRSPFSRQRSGSPFGQLVAPVIDPGAFTGRALNTLGKGWEPSSQAGVAWRRRTLRTRASSPGRSSAARGGSDRRGGGSSAADAEIPIRLRVQARRRAR